MKRVTFRLIAPVVFLLSSFQFLVSSSLAQCGGTWTQRMPASAPSGRYAHAMAFDSVRRVIVLFGGSTNAASGETWEWDGTNWTQRFPAAAPSARSNHEMAFDSNRAVTVLFGGYTAGGINGETWEWDGANWSQKSPATAPSARFDPAMAYDSARGVALLFGGATASGPVVRSAETWEWDGTNWSQRLPATAPTTRLYHSMAYDSARMVTVLFGGETAGGNSGQTWEWAGANWSERSPAAAPSARELLAMAYDDARRVTMLFGGVTAGSNGETWEWDGTNWSQRSPAAAPSARSEHAMAYDSVRSAIVLFGGLPLSGINGETWEWAGPAPAISQQPASQTIAPGQPAAFSITAGGPSPLTYRWHKDGTPLSDSGPIAGSTTANLTINPTAAADSGAYTCLVSNPCGATLSRAAALMINTPTPPPAAGCGMCGAGIAMMMPLTLLGFAAMRRMQRLYFNQQRNPQ